MFILFTSIAAAFGVCSFIVLVTEWLGTRFSSEPRPMTALRACAEKPDSGGALRELPDGNHGDNNLPTTRTAP